MTFCCSSPWSPAWGSCPRRRARRSGQGPRRRRALRASLPLAIVDTRRRIPDEPKVAGMLRIVDNGRGRRNRVRDDPVVRDRMGIEVRGYPSQQLFPKKQYALELRGGDAALLGLPADDDWVLAAPYNDKSLIRNVLAYRTARAIGRYAPRTRFVELVLNGDYRGAVTRSVGLDRPRRGLAVCRREPVLRQAPRRLARRDPQAPRSVEPLYPQHRARAEAAAAVEHERQAAHLGTGADGA